MTATTPYYFIGEAVTVQQWPLLEKGIATVPLWKKWVRKSPSALLQRGGNGRIALLALSAIPDPYRTRIINTFGEPTAVAHPMEQFFELDAHAQVWYEAFRFEDGSRLKPEQVTRYTLNASVLNCIDAFRKYRENTVRRGGHSTRHVWESVIKDMLSFSSVLERKYGMGHTVKRTRLAKRLKMYAEEGYGLLVDGRNRNDSAAKVKVRQEDDDRRQLIERLLRDPRNLRDTQVQDLYNRAAEKLGWPVLKDRKTVAALRAELGLYVEAGKHGITHHRTKRSMQVKRTKPTAAMLFWSGDAWVAELAYQTKADGRTTYHNRPTLALFIDPVGGLNYPIGYAIGTHETPELNRAALRNAVNHTRELFGSRFRPLQIQTDNYAIGKMRELYEGVGGKFTPAAVKNAKAKPVEHEFAHINTLCQLLPNWTGHNMDARRENQPNEDWLNQIRHSFPDWDGVVSQLERIMEAIRASKREAYLQYWENLPAEDRLPMATEDYLWHFGETHTYVNKLQGDGFRPTRGKTEYAFESFDIRFREMAYMDWAVKYDPTDMTAVLAVDAKSDESRRVKEVMGVHRFLLEQMHDQPMALYDRRDGDGAELAKVQGFNKNLEGLMTKRVSRNDARVEELFHRHPQLNDTLTKLVLTDSRGQHKDVKNAERLSSPRKSLPKVEEPEEYEIIHEDVRDQYGAK